LRSDALSVPSKLTLRAAKMAGKSFAIALTDEQLELVADLFDPPGRRGAPAQMPRRQMVEAILFLARTGCPAWARAAQLAVAHGSPRIPGWPSRG
jgi:transposase